ncbi:MAG: rRNA pseudouridine synthase [Campylobacteraceae bacterium]|nr:rRNA pseudouridine synthase [Campylobacteraceae bacterium]
MSTEKRLNKYISHNTKYSRREADTLISEGKVKVNNRVVTDLATKVKEDDKVKINERLIHRKDHFTMLVYHKQKGEIVSKKDDRGRKTIYDTLPRKYSNYLSVGRLDFASEGLLLLTDAPAVADALMHSNIERMYYLKIKGDLTDAMVEAMKQGFTAPDATKGAHPLTNITTMTFAPFLAFGVLGSSGGYTRLKVVINEGKNRELRRFFGYFDADVVELKRVSFGRVDLGMLKPGKSRFLTTGEYDDLRSFLKDEGVRY